MPDNHWVIALQLLGVGMITIFVILSLVVGIGRFLIYSVNRWGVLEGEKSLSLNDGTSISSEHIAAITATVEIITGGKGNIIDINRK